MTRYNAVDSHGNTLSLREVIWPGLLRKIEHYSNEYLQTLVTEYDNLEKKAQEEKPYVQRFTDWLFDALYLTDPKSSFEVWHYVPSLEKSFSFHDRIAAQMLLEERAQETVKNS